MVRYIIDFCANGKYKWTWGYHLTILHSFDMCVSCDENGYRYLILMFSQYFLVLNILIVTGLLQMYIKYPRFLKVL